MSDINQAADTQPEQGSDEGSSQGSNRRMLLMVGGAVGAVLLLGLAYMTFFSGGGDTVVAVGVTPNPGASVSPSPTSTKPATLPPTFDDKVGTDPFEPLAAEAVPVVAPSSTDAPTTAPTDAPTTAPTSAPTTAPTPAPTTTTSSAPVTSYKVTVKSIDGNKLTATLVVNGQTYTNVKKGDKLPKGETVQFLVSNIYTDPTGSYVVLQLGSGTPETVKEGKSTTFDFTA
ncbi:MAG: hypothetical protein WAN48_04465 [Actinomycetes bacterium]